jgi:transcriptional regulator with XRE-family HTH domain
MDIGFKISNLRKSKKISQPELAHRLGISQTALCDIESGKTKKVDFRLMCKVCKEFEVDFDCFLENSSLKKINKDDTFQYLDRNIFFNISEKLIEQYELRLKEKEYVNQDLKDRLKKYE